MIVVVAKLSVREGKGEAMRKLGATLAQASRREDGNISYACYQDALQPGAWFYFEEWSSQAALDAHFRSTHFTAAAQIFGDLLAAPPAVKVYEVSQARDLDVG